MGLKEFKDCYANKLHNSTEKEIEFLYEKTTMGLSFDESIVDIMNEKDLEDE